MRKIIRLVRAIFRSSLLWGGLSAAAFYTLIHSGTLQDKFFERYFTAHWTLYMETTLFFIGVAELLLKAFDITDQSARISQPMLGELPARPLPAGEARKLLEELNQRSDRELEGYLPRRLREALEAVVRKGSADALDEELKYLSEVDAARAHSGYALMHLVIWAIPILGFLGTVIGITMAIGSLNPKNLEASLDEVTFGLGVAFDTTALALVLSMCLMFGQFVIDRLESRLLGEVDSRATIELAGRFAVGTATSDPQVAAMQRIADLVLRHTEIVVERQAEVWQKTIDAAHHRWNELTSATQEQLETVLVNTLSRGAQAHAEQLAAAEAQIAQRNRRHWKRLQKSVADSTSTAQAQHEQIVKQGEVLLQVVEATGQVARLEDALNHNLASLAGAQHLQETLLSLSATIQLLNARLLQLAPGGPHVDLKEHTVGKAA